MITPKRADILEALALYGYLTPQQMLRLGLFGDANSLRNALGVLVRDRFLSTCKAWVRPGGGRFPAVYALTAAGAELIDHDTADLVAPLPQDPPQDIEHRAAIVDTHIALRAWLEVGGHRLARFTPDFTRAGTRGRKATAIQTRLGRFTPDALGMVQGADGVLRPLVVEVYRGGVTGRAGYLRSKLPQAVEHMTTQELQDALRPPVAEHLRSAARLLIVVDGGELLASLKRRVPEPELKGWGLSFVILVDDMKENGLARCWRPGIGETPLL